VVVVALEAHHGLEAGVAAGSEDDLAAATGTTATKPPLLGELGQRHHLALGERMALGERQVHRFGQHERALQVALLGLGDRRVVEAQRQVQLSAAQSR
jgi:hypothetical protein